MAACIVNADHCQIELYNDHVGRLCVGHSRAEKRGAAKILIKRLTPLYLLIDFP